MADPWNLLPFGQRSLQRNPDRADRLGKGDRADPRRAMPRAPRQHHVGLAAAVVGVIAAAAHDGLTSRPGFSRRSINSWIRRSSSMSSRRDSTGSATSTRGRGQPALR